MFALRNFLRRKDTGVRQILFCLIALSFLCRAAIPAGYMPDFSGGREGGYAVTLCIGGDGHDILQPDLTGQADQPFPDDRFDSKDCPFGIVASQAMLPSQQAPALLAVIAHHSVPQPHRNRIRPPLPAQGPPLGSRAPPSNLG